MVINQFCYMPQHDTTCTRLLQRLQTLPSPRDGVIERWRCAGDGRYHV